MNEPVQPSAGDNEGSCLCRACGLCCQGILHRYVVLDDAEVEAIERAGLWVYTEDGKPAFNLPCACHRGDSCGIYAQRPRACRSFQCELLKRQLRGEIRLEDALAVVGKVQALRASLLARLGASELPQSLVLRLRSSDLSLEDPNGLEPEGWLDLAALFGLCKKHFAERGGATTP